MSYYLRLTKTGVTDTTGLQNLELALYEEGKKTKTWIVNSGAPNAQTFRIYDDPKSVPGNMEPIPEGEYALGDLEFKGGKFDWLDSWGPGLGDLWVSIIHKKGEYRRSAFGFHLDENRGWAPGSAGCVVFRNKHDAEDWVQEMRRVNAKTLIVDWGFGTVEPIRASVEVIEDKQIKLYANDNGLTVVIDGKKYRAYSPAGGLKFKLISE